MMLRRVRRLPYHPINRPERDEGTRKPCTSNRLEEWIVNWKHCPPEAWAVNDDRERGDMGRTHEYSPSTPGGHPVGRPFVAYIKFVLVSSLTVSNLHD